MNESLLNTHKKNVILTKTLFAIWCILMLMNVIVEEKLINIFLYISCALVVFCVVVPLNKKRKE
ncbi:hypothetical protein BC30090_p340 (plasmid) [Bacillus cereus]|nr:hypothetical protein BC30090_p340 [Bacillus cereus]